MSDFAPPTGPPPPRVPEGWKAIWNDQYQEWFYVNLHTKQSTWEKPTEAAHDPNGPVPPMGAPPTQQHSSTGDDLPPSYAAGDNAPTHAGQDIKNVNLQSNNPYHQNTVDSDAELARRMQEEENARHGGGSHSTDRGASDSYYQTGSQQPQQQQQQGGFGYPTSQSYGQDSSSRPSIEKQRSGGLFGKIKDKISASQGSRPMGAPMMGYNAGGYPPQQQRYGGGGYGQNPLGYGPPQGHGYGGHGYGGGGYGGYGQPVKKKGGLGAGGAAALGVGGGLVGGMLLADAIDDHDDQEYDQGFDDGADFGDGGGDF